MKLREFWNSNGEMRCRCMAGSAIDRELTRQWDYARKVLRRACWIEEVQGEPSECWPPSARHNSARQITFDKSSRSPT